MTTVRAAIGPGKGRLIKRVWKYRTLYLLFAPVLLYFIIFRYYPMIYLSMSFMDYNPFKGLSGSPWVGLKHYISFFQSRDIWMLIRNTFLINILSLIIGFPSPIILALLLNEVRCHRLKKAVQTISYLPHFISTVVIVGMLNSFLSPSTGPVNQIIRLLGFEPIYFMINPGYFRWIYVLSGIWQNVGWGSIIYLAALSGIDPQLYEAAIVDGAGKWRQLVHITLPCIMGTIMIMLILRVGQLMSLGFEKIFLMGNDATRQVAEVISTYVYKRGIQKADYGFATAVGLFNSLVSFTLVMGANLLSKKTTEVGIW